MHSKRAFHKTCLQISFPGNFCIRAITGIFPAIKLPWFDVMWSEIAAELFADVVLFYPMFYKEKFQFPLQVLVIKIRNSTWGKFHRSSFFTVGIGNWLRVAKKSELQGNDTLAGNSVWNMNSDKVLCFANKFWLLCVLFSNVVRPDVNGKNLAYGIWKMAVLFNWLSFGVAFIYVT